MLNFYESMKLSEIESICLSVNEKSKGKLNLNVKKEDDCFSLFNNDISLNNDLDIDTLYEIVLTFQMLVYMS